MPVPHHLIFTDRISFLLPNQQRQSTEGKFGQIMSGGNILMASQDGESGGQQLTSN